jgi:hypothetical protein
MQSLNRTCAHKNDRSVRDMSAFTRVFDVPCAAMTALRSASMRRETAVGNTVLIRAILLYSAEEKFKHQNRLKIPKFPVIFPVLRESASQEP